MHLGLGGTLWSSALGNSSNAKTRKCKFTELRLERTAWLQLRSDVVRGCRVKRFLLRQGMPQMQKHRNVTSWNDLEGQLEFRGIWNHELTEKFVE